MDEPRKYGRPSDQELRAKLSALELGVTQHGATEPAFANRYWNHHEEGLYVDVATGEPLFSSRDKFDSGTGWPSFTRPVDGERVVERADGSDGMERVEVRSRGGESHLGHVFDDGPDPEGRRYCINSAALRFIPVDRLEAEGYGEYLEHFGRQRPAASPATETAILAGGCFWGMEELIRRIPGVIDTEVGYAGGRTQNPTYRDVSTGATGHAESVRVVFDPQRLSYAELLERWFFRMHDPTTPNRQGNDNGTQYRSAILVTSDTQRRIADEVRQRVDRSGRWRAPVVTQIEPAGTFTPAEALHQDYLARNPDGYTCHYLRD